MNDKTTIRVTQGLLEILARAIRHDTGPDDTACLFTDLDVIHAKAKDLLVMLSNDIPPKAPSMSAEIIGCLAAIDAVLNE